MRTPVFGVTAGFFPPALTGVWIAWDAPSTSFHSWLWRGTPVLHLRYFAGAFCALHGLKIDNLCTAFRPLSPDDVCSIQGYPLWARNSTTTQSAHVKVPGERGPATPKCTVEWGRLYKRLRVGFGRTLDALRRNTQPLVGANVYMYIRSTWQQPHLQDKASYIIVQLD